MKVKCSKCNSTNVNLYCSDCGAAVHANDPALKSITDCISDAETSLVSWTNKQADDDKAQLSKKNYVKKWTDRITGLKVAMQDVKNRLSNISETDQE